jgi:hypothetical protein
LWYNSITMKLRNINLSLLILVGLMFLSFAFFVVAQEQTSTANNVFLDSDQDGLTDAEEKTYGTDSRKADTDGDGYSDGAEVRSGYNPTKPAPGDKIVSAIETTSNQSVLGQSDTADSNENLTQKLAQKITEITSKSSEEDQNVSIEEIQSIVDDALNSNVNETDLPQIDKASIKIKKQNYSGLSAEKEKQKKKDDFINYITSVYYILSSNSPSPLTSSSDISNTITSLTEQITSAITVRNSSALTDLEKSGAKIEEQLKDVEVPQDLIDLHVKALSYAKYAQQLKKNIDPNSDDPIKDIANLSKIRAYIASLYAFTDEVSNKMSEYDVTYDETIKSKLKALGVDPPSVTDSDLTKILDTITSSVDTSSSDTTQ